MDYLPLYNATIIYSLGLFGNMPFKFTIIRQKETHKNPPYFRCFSNSYPGGELRVVMYVYLRAFAEFFPASYWLSNGGHSVRADLEGARWTGVLCQVQYSGQHSSWFLYVYYL